MFLMHRFTPWARQLSKKMLLGSLLGASLSALAQNSAPDLPTSFTAALAQARVPLDAISMVIVDADGQSAPRLRHRADAQMNPASTMKLVTTYAALDLLGPAYTWRTPVWLDGPVNHGVLKGNLVIQGQGDPKLVQERLWLLLRRVQGMGVQRIDGDIVLDRAAFAPLSANPGDFDGEPLRPYNATPDALLLNYTSVVMTFTPDLAAQVARVQYDPPLARMKLPASVPLTHVSANGKAAAIPLACGDYRGSLKADFSDPSHIRFAGSYPSSCGEKVWPVAYADPASYNARALEGLWRSMGGQLSGSVREGRAPATPATFEVTSPPLAEVIRDINKFSNNVMAQQVFLTLARSSMPSAPATREAAREVVQRWWLQRISPTDAPVIDNGSGLSRQERISAQGLARLLQVVYASPVMPELMASLPIVGVDGTLKRSQAGAYSAHLKTGSLREVLALAGYVHTTRGKPRILVAIINHANAAAARPALEALLDWAVNDSAAQ